MNTFLDVVREHEKEIERRFAPKQLSRLSYADASNFGFLKQISVRLPVDIIAKLQVIQEKGVWSSKQEVIYDIVICAVDDFYKSQSSDVQYAMDMIGERAIDNLDISDKARSIYQTAIPDSVRGEISEDDFVTSFKNGTSISLNGVSNFKPVEVKLLDLSEADGQLYGRVEITNAPFFIDLNDIQNLPEEGLHSGETVTFYKQGDKWVFVGKGVIEEVKQ